MGREVTVECEWCGESFDKPVSEVNRAMKEGMDHYCSQSCAGYAGNEKKDVTPLVERECDYCGEEFEVKEFRDTRHCSISCASKNSMTKERREKQRLTGKKHSGNLISAQEGLKKREGWKYEDLHDVLREEDYEFEARIDVFIYDLIIYSRNLVVEFDGAGHEKEERKKRDREKEELANKRGFDVVRKDVEKNCKIDPSVVESVL